MSKRRFFVIVIVCILAIVAVALVTPSGSDPLRRTAAAFLGPVAAIGAVAEIAGLFSANPHQQTGGAATGVQGNER